MDVTAVIEGLIKKQLPSEPATLIQWLEWYRGDVEDFHNYRIFNGMNEVPMRRKSLGMAKQVCETWANLLMNEKCDIVMPDNAKKIFDEILSDNNFWLKANDGVEKSFALGLGAFVVNVVGLEKGESSGLLRVTDKSRVTIDFVNRFKIKPVTIENKNVTECAFVTENSDSTHVVVHLRGVSGTYQIHNVKLDKEGKVLDMYIFDTKSTIPYFQILRPNISSNMLRSGYDNEIGISIFANSIDILKSIDNKYDGFDMEYVLGRKRLFVSSELWNHVEKTIGGVTKKTPVFDPYSTLINVMPNEPGQAPKLEDKSGELRADAYIRGINTELNLLSIKCGLGENYFRMDAHTGTPTATQVVSENSVMFRTLKKHEILIDNMLKQLSRVVIQASNDFTMQPIGEVKPEEIKIIFDDSIIEDKTSEMLRDRTDVTSGLMSHTEYRVKWYGEDENAALANIRKYMLYDLLNKYTPALQNGTITPTEFCTQVYGVAVPETVAYITEMLATPGVPDMNELYAGNEIKTDEDKVDEDDIEQED